MENASKALIIAGAILLAILIIGLAVFIYNQAANTVSDTGMDQVAARQFNGQFEPYLNKTIDSTSTKALIDTVESVRKSDNNRIRLEGITNKEAVETGHKYEISPLYENGLITKISITDSNGSTIIEEPGESGGTVISDNSIFEDTDVFNDRFTRYLGNRKSYDDYVRILKAVDAANIDFGANTVGVIEDKVPVDMVIDYYNISVEETYNDSKIKLINIECVYHSFVEDFNAQFAAYVPAQNAYVNDKTLTEAEARELVEIVIKSNKTYTWQVNLTGGVSETPHFDTYSTSAYYDSETGRLLSIILSDRGQPS